jgi:hypothetical protein
MPDLMLIFSGVWKAYMASLHYPIILRAAWRSAAVFGSPISPSQVSKSSSRSARPSRFTFEGDVMNWTFEYHEAAYFVRVIDEGDFNLKDHAGKI